ncbi:uncharacterized protein UTRI_10485_B [Ustilago trichophora]|uniref:Uncharacterized protein n=1 Tax=Ustilago trichophora TaxID=86804 RepID=A0A5C3E8K9_9BASI|nr:uncharacterized protein UTRI_10485_B [Ustilago trichophora]
MRAIPIVLLFMLILGSACNAAPAGPIPSSLAEDLARNTQQSQSISVIEAFFLNLRDKILRSKTTERLIRSFTTATPSSTATATSNAAAKAFKIPDEDALVQYSYAARRASTDAVTIDPARDGIRGRAQLEIWSKVRQIQAKSRTSADLSSSPRMIKRPSSTGPVGEESLSTTADRSLSNGMSPRFQRLPTTVSPRLQRGKEVEIMPLAPSPRTRKMVDVVERRKSTSIAEKSSMAKMRSYSSAFSRADMKLPLQKGTEQSENVRNMHYPTG